MQSQPASTSIYAVVEVVESDEIDFERLVRAAYRASARGPVLLLLRDVHPRVVDAILDPLVHTLGASVAGVRYVTVGSNAWPNAARSAKWIVALTSECREQLRKLGRDSVDPSTGLRLLEGGMEFPGQESP